MDTAPTAEAHAFSSYVFTCPEPPLFHPGTLPPTRRPGPKRMPIFSYTFDSTFTTEEEEGEQYKRRKLFELSWKPPLIKRGGAGLSLAKKKAKAAAKAATSRRRRYSHPIFDFSSKKEWLLLPPSTTSTCASSYIFKYVTTAKEAYQAIQDLSANRPNLTLGPKLSLLSRSFSVHINNPFYVNNTTIKRLTNIYEANQRLRFRFKPLLTAWLTKKKMTAANDVDICTMETPLQPVWIYDWAARKKYAFEAQTLWKDAIGRLLLNDGLWPSPRFPRNPYTNMDLTKAQTFHAFQQLKRHGKTHWTFEAFRTSAFSIEIFEMIHGKAIKTAVHERFFHNITSTEYKHVLKDFIENEHEHHNAIFNNSVYDWAIEHFIDADLMIEWRKACKLYYFMNNEISDQRYLSSTILAKIDPLTEPLCKAPITLIRAKRQMERS